jgi:hypothetical protein
MIEAPPLANASCRTGTPPSQTAYVFSGVVGVGGFWPNKSTDGSNDPSYRFNGWVG